MSSEPSWMRTSRCVLQSAQSRSNAANKDMRADLLATQYLILAVYWFVQVRSTTCLPT